MRDFVYSLRVRKRTLYFVVLHRVNFTIFLVGVMWYGMYKGGERYASFIYVFGIIVRMQSEKVEDITSLIYMQFMEMRKLLLE